MPHTFNKNEHPFLSMWTFWSSSWDFLWCTIHIKFCMKLQNLDGGSITKGGGIFFPLKIFFLNIINEYQINFGNFPSYNCLIFI
jgi:hypothetical protein